MTLMFVTRLRDTQPPVTYNFPLSTPIDVVKTHLVQNNQLSSPPQSYTFQTEENGDMHFCHNQSYKERLELSKGLRSRLQGTVELLKEAEEARSKTFLNWEVRHRIGSALHYDQIRQFNNNSSHQILKENGFGFLPQFLAIWAFERDPEMPVLTEIENEDSYRRKLTMIKKFGLSSYANDVWHSVDEVDRNLMIVMWVTRSQERTASAHPTPTKVYATTIIDSIPWIREEEIQQAKSIIENATDAYDQPLFADSDS